MHESLNMLVVLAAILIGARLAGHFSNRLGMPAVFGELLLGLVLGPAVLKLVQPNDSLDVLAQVGAIVLMFLAGMETDTAELRRVGRGATLVAAGGVLVPLGAGYALGVAFGLEPLHALFVGTVLTATSVSISAQVLGELGRLRSREGSTIMGAAIIDDVLGVAVFSLALSLAGQGSIWIALAKMALFFPIAWFVGDRLMPRLLQWDSRLKHREGWLAMGLGMVLIYAWAAERFGGVAPITGAYIAGILVAKHAHEEHVVHRGMPTLGSAFLTPIFFVSIGLGAQPSALAAAPTFTVALIAVAIITKIAGCGLGALASGSGRAEAVRIGAGMIGRGEVALVIAVAGRGAGLVDDTLFGATVVMAIVTTLVTPPLLRMAFTIRRSEQTIERIERGGLVEAEA
jgi:Kef-type K+ transport system membrane component KefB